ncbi:alpha/beta hydrolase [Mitsuaria sp. WAJ17]|uniref:alpha/beta fold hydrolase n=1 Tax=Mitsuaria sp. WAJ17 TaxID=2761452 RepID=UPI0016041A23|nr:alpha/beta hydrolase [Mitsuaria sp. WAJ17]MBB2486104.1 alpha/beta hydrolase [Mitsuaria sp. WAJ17]
MTLLPLWVLMVPAASRHLPPLPEDPAVQPWPTSDGRSVAVYRIAPDAGVQDRQQALVFVHGGPGAYIRNFDRDFFAGFAREGFEVVLYDQFGSGRSPQGDGRDYTHDGNVADLLAILDRIGKPTVLVGQSYGAAIVASALQSPRARKWVTQVVLTEPGKLPGSTPGLDPALNEKTTRAPDASEAPSLAVLSSMLAPRMLVGTLLPAGNLFVPQEELINLASPAVQRNLISSGYCRGSADQLDRFQPLRFNPAANMAVGRSATKAQQPTLREALKAPVLLMLGECSYVPRGRAMAYFDAMPITRAQWLQGVGHILWGTPKGQALVHEAIVRFVDGKPAALPNEPTRESRDQFVRDGR